MMDLLSHLWPNFSLLFTPNTNGISAWFWLITAGIFFISVFSLIVHFIHFTSRMRALDGLLDGQTKENLAVSRREVLKKAESLGRHARGIGKLWREFDESLVSSGDKQQLFNTLDAEHFFNARTLASGLTASRLLAAAPSFLVAIGVLGTFIGLTIGLESLQVNSATNVDALRSGIDGLIRGAAVAFMTSVWGVTFSLLLNFIEKMLERNALARIHALQQTIDFLYPRIPAEQSLVHIADYSKESSQALQELHERIGDRLQESIQGMSEAMQTALTDVLNKIMGPAIQSLVTTSGQQSSLVLERLIGNFMEGMSAAGREQGGLMERAAADVNAAVGGMAEKLDQLFGSLSAQQVRQLEISNEWNDRFDSQLQRISSSAEDRQQQMEQRFSELMQGLSTQLESQFGAAHRREEERQKQFDQRVAATRSSQEDLLQRVCAATESQLHAMATAGAERHRNLEEVFERQLGNLATQSNAQAVAAEQREQERAARHAQQQAETAQQQREFMDEIARSVAAVQTHSARMAEQHRELVERLRAASEAAAASSKHMDSSAVQLGLLSTHVRQAAELLGARLESVTQRIESTGKQNAEIAEQMMMQATSLAELQEALLDGARRFEQAAIDARSGFTDMKSIQKDYLEAVRTEFSALGESLRKQVESIEKQAEQWLQSYSTAVSAQIDERMMKWNEVSHAYADQMLHAVQAMSGIIDELESR
jgi:hypothetical protein